jgi:thiosulfate reductase/polysulfide reductase chain A
MTLKIVKAKCMNCIRACGARIQVDGDMILKAEGDSSDPLTKGYFCPMGSALPQIIYSSERLMHPLKREGEKGTGKWRKISWEEALSEIANRLGKLKDGNNPEAFVLGLGNIPVVTDPFTSGRFLHEFGSPNRLTHQHICGLSINFAALYTYGWLILNGPELENSKCIVAWGCDPNISEPRYLIKINEALSKGARLIVVDPRLTDMASKADVWLQVRPGTDGALALGMLNVIISNNLYDDNFVKHWTIGFDKLCQYIQQWPPDKVERITWVPSELIDKAAHMYAQSESSSIAIGSSSLSQNVNCFQANRAIAILASVCGNIDKPGGNVNYLSPLGERSVATGQTDGVLGKLSDVQVRKRLGAERFRALAEKGFMLSHPKAVWKAILLGKPYPVEALFLIGMNPLITFENSMEVRRALMKLDFLAVSELFMTPTAELADIVLPASHWSEREDIIDIQTRGWVFAQPKVVEPPDECWSDRKIIIELAKRLGLEFWESEKEIFNFRLEHLGITWEQLRKKFAYERPVEYKKHEKSGRLLTRSGKVELYSDILKDLGYDPLPSYVEPPESPISAPELSGDYPLVLTGHRIPFYSHSCYRNIANLHEMCPDPFLEIHPDTAKGLGIRDGDWVRIETVRGSIKHKAKLTKKIQPRVVSAPHGWWYGYHDGWKEVNINVLTGNEFCDPHVGSPLTRGLLCRVTKA